MKTYKTDESPIARVARKLSDARLIADAVDIPPELEVALAAGATCDLARVPGINNWVEANGDLPIPIADVACALIRDHGFTISHAIATAVSRAKVFAVDPKYTAKTHAKFSKAIAAWEEMRAKAHAKHA